MEAAGVFTVADAGGTQCRVRLRHGFRVSQVCCTRAEVLASGPAVSKGPPGGGEMALCYVAAGQGLGTKPVP